MTAPKFLHHPYWPVGAVRIGQFRVKYNNDCVNSDNDQMVRFTSMCNIKFSSNVTEATDHYFEGKPDMLVFGEEEKQKYCYNPDQCPDYEYSDL